MTDLLGRLPLFLAAYSSASEWRDTQLRSMRMRFQHSDPGLYGSIVIGVVAVASIFVVLKVLSYWQSRRLEAARPQPFSLYRRVQAQLGLSWLDRWQLWRLARSLKVVHPTSLLLSPTLYDRAVEQYGKGRTGGNHARLADIRIRLFGQPASEFTNTPID